jgi:hypothetical protein
MADNILKKIGDGIADYAPSLAKILNASGIGAPAGIALDVMSSLAKAFGCGTNATPDEIHTAIASDPQSALKLALAEQDFILKKREQDIEFLKTQLSDIQSARTMDVDKTKATGKRDYNLYALAWLNTLGFYIVVGVFIWMLGHGKTIEAMGAMGTIIVMLIGNLSSNYTSVNSYFFGSSQGSAQKTELLAKADSIKN